MTQTGVVTTITEPCCALRTRSGGGPGAWQLESNPGCNSENERGVNSAVRSLVQRTEPADSTVVMYGSEQNMDDAIERETIDWAQHGVRIVRSGELDTNTPQTAGMTRAEAISRARVGAQKLWAGTVVVHPNAKTGPHHHGDLETVIYIVRGTRAIPLGKSFGICRGGRPRRLRVRAPIRPASGVERAAGCSRGSRDRAQRTGTDCRKSGYSEPRDSRGRPRS